MAFDHQRTERLRAEIELKRVALAEERTALQKLQNEVAAFAKQYDRMIGPLEAELDGVRQQIEALQTRPVVDHSSIWGPGYSSFEESFDAKYRQSQNPTIKAPRSAVNDDTLRALYRKLARKYHPDTTTDPDEKARLTIIMAQINAAYRARNIDELHAIDGEKPKGQKITPPVVEPTGPHELTYSDLIKIAEGLDAEIAWTRSEHSRLMSGPLMSLKIEASIARSQGRDLLREIAAKIKNDLEAARAELAELRRIR
jgi:hypothetical protein